MVEIAPFVKTDFKAVDKHAPLHSVKAWITGDRAKLPLVVDKDRPFGIVNERALMGKHMDLNAHIHQFTLSTRALAATDSVEQATERLAEFRAAYLPIEDERHKLVGYVSALDLAREGLNRRSASDLAVPVTTLREDQTVGDALHAFAKEYVEYLPVVRADGRVAGVLSRAAILRVEFDNGDKGRKDAGGEKLRILEATVDGLMEPAPAVLAPTESFDTLARAIDEHGYAIVGAAGRIHGIATAETLFRPIGR